jgi:hypothetical protein
VLKESAMNDQAVGHRIDALAQEEHELFQRESQGKASEADIKRLREIEIMLDRCWDLLRQRRARRAAGQDPDEAQLRDARTVEGYTG